MPTHDKKLAEETTHWKQLLSRLEAAISDAEAAEINRPGFRLSKQSVGEIGNWISELESSSYRPTVDEKYRLTEECKPVYERLKPSDEDHTLATTGERWNMTQTPGDVRTKDRGAAPGGGSRGSRENR